MARRVGKVEDEQAMEGEGGVGVGFTASQRVMLKCRPLEKSNIVIGCPSGQKWKLSSARSLAQQPESEDSI